MKRLSAAVIGFCLVILTGSAVWMVYATRQEPLARFTTDLSERSSDQRCNIGLAARALDGAVVKPGKVFSFNRTLGPCGPARGYRRAPAIQAGEIRPDWGGGICQLSSTLYNAVLLAGMEITERNPHSTPARSVPPGRDAAVSAGVSDLAFRNTSGSPVTILAKAEKERLVVTLLGRRESDREIQIYAKVLDRLPPTTQILRDPSLTPGRHLIASPGQEGYLVEVSRVSLRNGREIRREIVSRDTYHPVNRLLRIGAE